jgi:hypothetical protein
MDETQQFALFLCQHVPPSQGSAGAIRGPCGRITATRKQIANNAYMFLACSARGLLE